MNPYPMTITSHKGDTFIFKDGDHVRWLTCPSSRRKQISKCGNFYNFEKNTALKYNINAFKFIKQQNAHSFFAKRLWDGLWEEGWRQAKL
jgi:hypothetical protein